MNKDFYKLWKKLQLAFIFFESSQFWKLSNFQNELVLNPIINTQSYLCVEIILL